MSRSGEPHYGPTVRQLRLRVGISGRKFAELLGMGPDNLYRAEHGVMYYQRNSPHILTHAAYLQAIAILRAIAAERIIELRKVVEEIDSGKYD